MLGDEGGGGALAGWGVVWGGGARAGQGDTESEGD